jgi:hypothetical protein
MFRVERLLDTWRVRSFLMEVSYSLNAATRYHIWKHNIAIKRKDIYSFMEMKSFRHGYLV